MNCNPAECPADCETECTVPLRECRGGVQNILFVILTLVVLAVTSLNHYTTQKSAEYFLDVSQQETRELVRVQAVQYAQGMANNALSLAKGLEAERDQARTIAISAMEKGQALYELCQVQEQYIAELEGTLKKNNVKLPNGQARAKPAQPAQLPKKVNDKST